MKKPVVDISECVKCDICVDLLPSVFIMNDAGYVEVVPLEEYPQEDVDDVIRNCRADCVSWDEEA